MKLYEQTPYLKAVVEQTGYLDLRSLLFLHNLVEQVKPECVIELGTGYGCSAIFMALGGAKSVVSVDDYRGDTSLNIDVTKINIEKCNVCNQVTLLKGDSRDKLVIKDLAEMCFMDASHNPEDLCKELGSLKTNLSANHVLVIDDIFSIHLDTFSFDLLRQGYQALHVFPFHNGVAVLNTNEVLYGCKISKAAEAVLSV